MIDVLVNQRALARVRGSRGTCYLLLLPLSLTPALTLVAAIVVVVVVVVVVMATAAALPATALPDAVQLLGSKLPGAGRRPRL